MQFAKRFGLIGLSVFVLSFVVIAADVEWGYEGVIGPAFWGVLDESFALCGVGQTQSPIDIDTSSAVSANLPDISLDYHETEVVIFNNSHTIEVEYETGSFLNFNGSLYELLQFHFHAPSEHTINGESFPMEVHFVHLCGRCFFRSESGSISVLGAMIREGAENEQFATFWDSLPTEVDVEFDLGVHINAADIIPADLSAYRYAGSLTTPACTEGVNWFVLEEPIEMSAAQIEQFRSALAASCCPFNNRPVQPLNGREIQVDSGAD